MPGGSTEEPRSDEEDGVIGSSAEPSSTEPSSAEITPDDAPDAEVAPSPDVEPSADVSPPPEGATSPASSPVPGADFFMLRGWEADTASIDPASRRDAIDRAAVSAQRRAAAETLWASGHPAEALALARHAYRTALDAFDGLKQSALKNGHRLTAESKRERAVLDEAQKNVGRELPVLDAAIKTADEECYQTWLDAQAILVARCNYFSANRQNIRAAQAARVGTVVTLALIALVSFLWSNRRVYEITASGSWNGQPQFAPENVFDGNPATEWLLPEHSNGWVQLEVRPARTVTTIRVTNGHNAPVSDRAVRAYRVELYRDGEHLRDLSGSFDTIDASAPTTEFSVDERFDRVRFVVVSHHGLGGALAELSLE